MLPIRQNLLTLTCLKSTAKAVLVEVCELAENGGKGACYASNTTLAQSLGLSKPTVVRMVTILEEGGLLSSEVVKSQGNRRYLRPTPRLRACYLGGTEAQQLAAASLLTIVKNEVDYSQKEGVTIVKNEADYSQNSSRVLGDDQNDHSTTTHDQPLAASEREGYQKKIGELEAEVASLKAQLARKASPPVAPPPPRFGYRDFCADWPEQLRPPFRSPEFREAWAKWAAYRFEIGKTFGGNISEQADLDKLSKLASGDEAKALKIISDTISSNWKNLTYDEPHRNNSTGQRPVAGNGRPNRVEALPTYGCNRGPASDPTYGRNRGPAPDPAHAEQSAAVAA
jgi:DNA-binding MarR family transcriptional regulator